MNTATAVDTDAEARSILTANCQKCHGPSKQKGGLRLDSRDGALGKGDSGSPAIIPGKAASSEVMRRVTAKNPAERMPPDGTGLTAAQIDALRKWIDAGAAWPKRWNSDRRISRRRNWSSPTRTASTGRSGHSKRSKSRPRPADRVRTPIDRFILDGLAAKKLTPAPPADPRVLIRRVTFDLTGLPPTPDEVEAFVRQDPDAATKRSSIGSWRARITANAGAGTGSMSPGTPTATATRATSTGRDAYHYRDFVIQALNDDMPFDDFVRRQLAGDEFAPDDPRAVVATGFLAAGPSETLPDELPTRNRRGSATTNSTTWSRPPARPCSA